MVIVIKNGIEVQISDKAFCVSLLANAAVSVHKCAYNMISKEVCITNPSSQIKKKEGSQKSKIPTPTSRI